MEEARLARWGRGAAAVVLLFTVVDLLNVKTAPWTSLCLAVLGLAILVHALLLGALGWGVSWRHQAEPLTVEAELWSAVPQQAARMGVGRLPVAHGHFAVDQDALVALGALQHALEAQRLLRVALLPLRQLLQAAVEEGVAGGLDAASGSPSRGTGVHVAGGRQPQFADGDH